MTDREREIAQKIAEKAVRRIRGEPLQWPETTRDVAHGIAEALTAYGNEREKEARAKAIREAADLVADDYVVDAILALANPESEPA